MPDTGPLKSLQILKTLAYDYVALHPARVLGLRLNHESSMRIKKVLRLSCLASRANPHLGHQKKERDH